MRNNKKLQIVAHLRGLANGKTKPRIKWVGLCAELENKFDVSLEELPLDVTKYPEYSGDGELPIKSTDKSLSAGEQYFKVAYKWRGRYGNARKHFCGWLADRLEETIK